MIIRLLSYLVVTPDSNSQRAARVLLL